MTASRNALKAACTKELRRQARPHSAGHTSYAGRYILDTSSGPVALMFEHSDTVPAHIWLPIRVTSMLKLPPGKNANSPASMLWKRKNRNGEAVYGRHSNLLQMPELKDSDLIKITLDSVEELRVILSDPGVSSGGRHTV